MSLGSPRGNINQNRNRRQTILEDKPARNFAPIAGGTQRQTVNPSRNPRVPNRTRNVGGIGTKNTPARRKPPGQRNLLVDREARRKSRAARRTLLLNL